MEKTRNEISNYPTTCLTVIVYCSDPKYILSPFLYTIFILSPLLYIISFLTADLDTKDLSFCTLMTCIKYELSPLVYLMFILSPLIYLIFILSALLYSIYIYYLPCIFDIYITSHCIFDMSLNSRSCHPGFDIASY